jgi:hypothetical protein
MAGSRQHGAVARGDDLLVYASFLSEHNTMPIVRASCSTRR